MRAALKLNRLLLFVDGARPVRRIMADETDGLTIARQRIVQEAAAPTGFLDLGQLGLTPLPELFRLTHLRRLNLGTGMFDNDGEWRESSANLSPNHLEVTVQH
jgi:hypothetical protein